MSLAFNSPLLRSFIGYDDLFKDLEVVFASKDTASYPPFNVWSVKPTQQDVAETTYVELAVAGFKKCELEVYLENNVLTVKGQKQSNTPINGYRGIAKRDFVRQFRVGEKYIVQSAKLEDGILTIRLDLPLSKKMEARIQIQ